MDPSSGPRLTPELLIKVARFALNTFTDQELWFDLSQVLRLFRAEVEQYVTTTSPLHDALCTSRQSKLSRENYSESCIIRVVSNCMEYTTEWTLHSIIAEKPGKAHFRQISDSRSALLIFEDDETMRDVLRYYVRQSPHEDYYSCEVDCVTGFREHRAQTTTPRFILSKTDIGPIIDVDWDLTEDGEEVFLLVFDWRRIFTAKCATERDMEYKLL